jgi:hypothetical protein
VEGRIEVSSLIYILGASALSGTDRASSAEETIWTVEFVAQGAAGNRGRLDST